MDASPKNSMFATKPKRDEIVEHFRKGIKVLEVFTKRATYKGKNWIYLSDYDKRKYENLLIIENSQEPIKIIYTHHIDRHE